MPRSSDHCITAASANCQSPVRSKKSWHSQHHLELLWAPCQRDFVRHRSTLQCKLPNVSMAFQGIISQPFNVLWRTALVRLPRAVPTQILHLTDPEGPYPFIVNVKSRGQHEIPVYVFISKDMDATKDINLPVVIDFHGGGFVLGSCLEQAPFCSKLARELGAVVMTVDYRMGPINKFPAAIHDAEDVLSAVLDTGSRGYDQLRKTVTAKILENWKDANTGSEESEESEEAPQPQGIFDLDKSRIAISGFSSGGNLALNLGVSVTESDSGEPWRTVFPQNHPHPIPLLLFYPSFDSRQLPSERTKPPNLPVSSPFWSQTSDVLAPTYLPRHLAGHPRASPGLANIQEGLHAMARILLVLPGLDSLAEQSEKWIEDVRDADRHRHLRVERFETMTHGWTQMPDSWLNEEQKNLKTEIYDAAVDFTRRVWNGEETAVEERV